MPPDMKIVRYAHLKRYHLPWLCVSHFLSADLLRELVIALVDEVGSSDLTFDALFEERLSEGAPFLASWCVRPRPTDDPLGAYLQRLLQALLWANDHTPGLSSHAEQGESSEQMQNLATALQIAIADLNSPELRATVNIPEPLRPLVNAMATLRDASSIDSPAIRRELAAVVGAVEAPLCAVLVKHLGDLCVDIDCWAAADDFYERSEQLLAKDNEPAWAEFRTVFQSILLSSRAATIWAKDGALAASHAYTAGSHDATLKTRPLIVVNSLQDQMAARYAAAEGFSFLPDHRATVLLAPQLIASRGLASAFENWAVGKYQDANRRFWAVLRRQTALGSVSAARDTRAAFGRCLIDGLAQRIGQQRLPDEFLTGIRLIVEGEGATVATEMNWSEALTTAYVDVACAETVVAYAARAPGVTNRRKRAIIVLFRQWLEVLSPDDLEVAGFMLRYLADGARNSPRAFFSDRDIGGQSLKALAEIARKRPEFRRLAAPAIADAIRHQLSEGDFLRIGEALEALISYIDAMGSALLRPSIVATLEALDRIGPAAGHWTIVRPALNVLVSDEAAAAVRDDPKLRARMAATTVRFALEQDSEHTRLLLLLRDQDPDLVDKIEAERLNEVVRDVRRRAHEINSSDAAGCIYALVAAPRLVGTEGFEDALAAARAILRAATTQHESISFPSLYDTIILLARHESELARDLGLSPADLRQRLTPVCDALHEVWSHAPKNPLIFTQFQIPIATAPNTTLVHNWTFASLGLARILNRGDVMIEVIEAAARQAPILASGIASGRAARVAVGDPDAVDLAAIASETRDGFYAALGTRLVHIRELPEAERRKKVGALLEHTFRLGPKGVDAGIFATALDSGFRATIRLDGVAADYRKRLNNDRELRLGLAPLFLSLCADET